MSRLSRHSRQASAASADLTGAVAPHPRRLLTEHPSVVSPIPPAGPRAA